jgi:hypothetical protein
MKLTGQDADEVASEAEKASKKLERQHHSIFGKKKKDKEVKIENKENKENMENSGNKEDETDESGL